MSASLPKLKPRDTFFLVVGVCLLLLLAWYFMRFQTRQNQIQDLNTQLDLSNTQLQGLQDQQAKLPALRTQVAELDNKQKVFVRALPQTLKMGQVISDLRDSVLAYGGNINGLTSQPSTEANLPAGVQATSLTLNTQSRFDEMFRTLQSVEIMGRFSKITGVNIKLPAPNAKDPELDSTINLTVYTFDPAKAQPTAPNSVPGGASAPAAPAPAAPSTSGGNS